MSVDWTKPIQTKNGLNKRHIGSLHYRGYDNPTRVVVGIDKDGREDGVYNLVHEDGMYYPRSNNYDDHIINVPPRKETREVVAWAAVDHAGRVLYHGDLSIAETVMSQRKTAQLVRLTGTYEVEVPE